MNSQKRILYIIERLVAGECSTKALCFEIFRTEESAKIRVIQNDIKLLKELFPELIISTKRGFNRFIKVPNFIKNIATTEGKEAKELLEFMMIFDNSALAIFEKDEPKLIKHLKKETRSIYHIHEYPFEQLKSPFLKEIKQAIKQHRYVYIKYQGNIVNYYKKSQIYRIIYANSNWYIAVYNITDNGYKDFLFLRINFIQDLKILPKTFNRDICIEKFTENFQTLFSIYKKEPYKVILQVDKPIMRHFLLKKHLSSQEIIEKREDRLILKFQITNNMEILPLIKHWIPNIKILSAPPDLKEQLKRDIENYLKEL